MSRPTRPERLRRQELDTGDPDDTVYLAGGGSYNTLFYHDDPDCQHLHAATGELKTETRRGAKRRWKAPCSTCILGALPTTRSQA